MKRKSKTLRSRDSQMCEVKILSDWKNWNESKMQTFVSEMKYLPIAILVSKNFRFVCIILIYTFQKSWTPIKNENRWTLEIRYIKIEAFPKRLHCNLYPAMVQTF